jgi:prepilin-type N-terminal cleavage/methylation domain-containing protein
MKKEGFSLIELMIVIVIIGILAIIAMPSYKKYITKSKMAESYNVLDNMGKIEFAAYSEFKEFIPLVPNNTTGGPTADSVAASLPNSGYGLFGYPIAPGSKQFFVYYTVTGKFDASGTAVADSIHRYPVTTSMFIPFNSVSSLVSTRYPSDGTRCHPTLSVADLGITAQANYDWTVLGANADFKGDEGLCTMVLRTMDAVEKNPKYRSGFIVVNEGE